MDEKVAQGRNLIFPLTRSSQPFKKIKQTIFSCSGLSLVETMVVLMILVLVISTALPQFQSKNQRIKTTLRNFLVLGNRTLHNARLKNQIHRLVIDLGKEEKGENRKQSHWVEVSSSPFALISKDLQKNRKSEEEEEEKENKKEPLFASASTLTKKPISWPRRIRFESVELPHQKEPLSYNHAYIYFFPSGFIEEAAVHLSIGEKGKKTIYFNSITGEIKEFNKKIPLKEILNR